MEDEAKAQKILLLHHIGMPYNELFSKSQQDTFASDISTTILHLLLTGKGLKSDELIGHQASQPCNRQKLVTILEFP